MSVNGRCLRMPTACGPSCNCDSDRRVVVGHGDSNVGIVLLTCTNCGTYWWYVEAVDGKPYWLEAR